MMRRRGERIFVSPLARRMAKQAGIDLAALKGSGPNGRIVKADIEARVAEGRAGCATACRGGAGPVAARPPAAPITAPHTLVPHSSIRKVIARRLTEAKSTIPHFYVSMDVEIDALIKLMGELNAKSPKEGPDAYLITINDLVIKAVGRSAAPRADGERGVDRRRDGAVRRRRYQRRGGDPGRADHADRAPADQKGLATISREMKDLAGRARAGKLKPEEFQGGGFSISNMGMFGVSEFAAIINPPQAAILAVAAGQKRPVVKNDALAIATVMTCTLSVDHRVVDGALGARWLRGVQADRRGPAESAAVMRRGPLPQPTPASGRG